MNQFANAFGDKFLQNKDSLRIRNFELGGHTFKVKVPLTAENEAMFERIKIVDEAKVLQYYADLSKEFIDNKDQYASDSDVEFKDDDIIIKGQSLKTTARNKVITENRILEYFRLLVPENKDFDMSTVKYSEVEELFPFPIQLELIEKINSVVSPGYKETKGK